VDDATLNDALKLEERNWDNWLVTAEKTRDQELVTLAATSARDGVYQSGGRLKGDVRIIFAAIDEVVTKAVALRKELALHNPTLGGTENLSPLRAKIAAFTNAGVGYTEDRASRTMPGIQSGMRTALLRLAHDEATAILDRATNDLENIPLGLKLRPRKDDRSITTLHIGGSSNIINLGTALGDLNTSVQTLNQGNQKDIADAIQMFGKAIQESAELNDANRRAYLEHLTTVSEQVAKPPEQRRIATFTNAINNLASITSAAMKMAPLYHQLVTLLTEHHILDK